MTDYDPLTEAGEIADFHFETKEDHEVTRAALLLCLRNQIDDVLSKSPASITIEEARAAWRLARLLIRERRDD